MPTPLLSEKIIYCYSDDNDVNAAEANYKNKGYTTTIERAKAVYFSPDGVAAPAHVNGPIWVLTAQK